MGAQLDTGGKQKGAKPNINVTPLVDVVLVLLIIFMVVLPDVQEGKNIEIVKVDEAEKTSDGEEPLTITIDGKEVYTLGQDDTTRDAVLAELRRTFTEKPGQRVLLRADANLPYRVVRSFFAEVQQIGFVNIALGVGVSAEWSAKHGEG